MMECAWPLGPSAAHWTAARTDECCPPRQQSQRFQANLAPMNREVEAANFIKSADSARWHLGMAQKTASEHREGADSRLPAGQFAVPGACQGSGHPHY